MPRSRSSTTRSCGSDRRTSTTARCGSIPNATSWWMRPRIPAADWRRPSRTRARPDGRASGRIPRHGGSDDRRTGSLIETIERLRGPADRCGPMRCQTWTACRNGWPTMRSSIPKDRARCSKRRPPRAVPRAAETTLARAGAAGRAGGRARRAGRQCPCDRMLAPASARAPAPNSGAPAETRRRGYRRAPGRSAAPDGRREAQSPAGTRRGGRRHHVAVMRGHVVPSAVHSIALLR